jgi:hypothetical protein
MKPAGEDLSQVISLKIILSDCANAFVEIKRTSKQLSVAENLDILVF